MVEGSVWLCDRGDGGALYRFDPLIGTFTWWAVGFDTAPLYIEPGHPSEYRISLERTGKIARLALQLQ
ncbi:hypothetical protein KAJ02_09635 [Candidatus Bipolaricaulota bacterium]|nr:hypothetical protein [Candidatus Bipolaricaulota bacterium]